ncbi:hypothetical protein M758_9G074900 [Ceratodon purpureus]|nr:hypothetical protein M758_9G074900 [Ceratodon purpureus]
MNFRAMDILSCCFWSSVAWCYCSSFLVGYDTRMSSLDGSFCLSFRVMCFALCGHENVDETMVSMCRSSCCCLGFCSQTVDVHLELCFIFGAQTT